MLEPDSAMLRLVGLLCCDWRDAVEERVPKPVAACIEIVTTFIAFYLVMLIVDFNPLVLASVVWPVVMFGLNPHATTSAIACSWYPILFPLVSLIAGAFSLCFSTNMAWDGQGPLWLRPIVLLTPVLFCITWIFVFVHAPASLLYQLLAILSFQLVAAGLACITGVLAVYGFSESL